MQSLKQDRTRFRPILLLALALAAPSTLFGAAAPKKSAPQPPAASQQPRNPYVERFKELDRDGDGFVSRAEWPLAPESFDIVDRNKDGRLSAGELLTPNVMPRDRYDLEIRELEEDAARRRLEPPRAAPRPPVNPADVWHPGATLQDQRRFQALDRNRDNRLEPRELNSVLFNRLDRNRDGVISPDEWPRR